MANGSAFALSALLSAANGKQIMNIDDILFYVNVGMIFCTLAEFTALCVLCKKTSCAIVVGFAAVLILGGGIVSFAVQLVMYVYNINGRLYAVYFGAGIQYAGFILACVYSFMLSRNSHKTLCAVTGVFDLIPPCGVFFSVILSKRIGRDTSFQELLYNGSAYTYAALGDFCSENVAKLVDTSGDESYENLTRKQIKNKLKALKKKATTPEGRYEYASALATYVPEKIKLSAAYLKKSATDNYAPALFNLGYYFEIGAGVKQDIQKAETFYKRAAKAGDGDAQLRLGILEIKSGNACIGVQTIKNRVENADDIYAEYDLGVCVELGIAASIDKKRAFDIYYKCASQGLTIAQKRIFALAAADIRSDKSAMFDDIVGREYTGNFAVMIKGLVEIKNRLASDASEYFLKAVQAHDAWEGVARCLVGTLYIDRGKTAEDRFNGAEYIKSALGMCAMAKNIYAVLPPAIKKHKRKDQVAK